MTCDFLFLSLQQLSLATQQRHRKPKEGGRLLAMRLGSQKLVNFTKPVRSVQACSQDFPSSWPSILPSGYKAYLTPVPTVDSAACHHFTTGCQGFSKHHGLCGAIVTGKQPLGPTLGGTLFSKIGPDAHSTFTMYIYLNIICTAQEILVKAVPPAPWAYRERNRGLMVVSSDGQRTHCFCHSASTTTWLC